MRTSPRRAGGAAARLRAVSAARMPCAPQERRIVIAGHSFSAGLLYIKGLGLEVGLDFNTAELKSARFFRAVVVRAHACVQP
jgi:hypothetical protein